MIKTFKESIIDIPRKTYAPGVFDDADTNNPKIKKSVKNRARSAQFDFEHFLNDLPFLFFQKNFNKHKNGPIEFNQNFMVGIYGSRLLSVSELSGVQFRWISQSIIFEEFPFKKCCVQKKMHEKPRGAGFFMHFFLHTTFLEGNASQKKLFPSNFQCKFVLKSTPGRF